MTEEIKSIPDSPGIWQRESDGSLLAWNSNYYFYLSGGLGGIMHQECPPGRYRKISTVDGKQVCDPSSEWTSPIRIEKLRMIIYLSEQGCRRLAFEIPDTKYNYFNSLLDEMRECKLDENDEIVEILEYDSKYKQAFIEALEPVDEVFQYGILKDYVPIGHSKFQAVKKLANEFVQLRDAVEQLEELIMAGWELMHCSDGSYQLLKQTTKQHGKPKPSIVEAIAAVMEE